MKILDGELQETLFDWPTSSADADEVAVADITEGSTASSSRHNELHGQPLAISRNTVYQPNQVTYVHGMLISQSSFDKCKHTNVSNIYYLADKIGLHRISNPSTERGAVSLHLYTPPYQMCKTFEENTGRARSSGICSFYSIGGNRIQADNK